MRKSLVLFLLFTISLLIYARIDKIEKTDVLKSIDIKNQLVEKEIKTNATPLDSIYLQTTK
jgi:hypothetical protein